LLVSQLYSTFEATLLEAAYTSIPQTTFFKKLPFLPATRLRNCGENKNVLNKLHETHQMPTGYIDFQKMQSKSQKSSTGS